MMAEKRVTFTNDYKKLRGPSHGSGEFTYNNTGNRHQAGRDITDTHQSTYDGTTHFHPRSIWGNPTRNNTFNSGGGRPFNRYQKQFVSRNDDNDDRNGSTGAPSKRTWQNIGAIQVLLQVRDEIHSQVDSISPRGLLHLIIWFSDDLTAKNPAVLFPMNSASREPMTNLALTQHILPLRTIHSMHYPTSAR